MKKPPIGLIPKKDHTKTVNEQRLNEVRGAICRYYEAELCIDLEWIKEYNELINEEYEISRSKSTIPN